jgi:hypothetical protein
VIGLYAIARGAPREAIGARGERVRILRVGTLEAVCGEPPPPLSEDALRAHEAAVRRIAEAAQACLPARFGASAADEASLNAALSAREAEMAGALALVEGREQMTLRVHGDPTDLPLGGGPGTRYLEARRRSRSLPELAPLRTALSGLTRAERIERHGEPGLLASVYHLIDRGSAQAYREVVEGTRLDGLRVTFSGPWPAWSFAPEITP